MQTSGPSPHPGRTWRISAEKLKLALVVRRIRPQTRWAVMSAHATTSSCRPHTPGGGWVIHADSMLQPMHRGDLHRCVERARRHNRHEPRLTWGAGIRAIRAEVGGGYILQAPRLDAAAQQQGQQRRGAGLHGGRVGQQGLAQAVALPLLCGLLVGIGSSLQPAGAAPTAQLHAQPVQHVGIQRLGRAPAPVAFGHVAHLGPQLGHQGVDLLGALHAQAQPVASPEGQKGQHGSHSPAPVDAGEKVDYFWHTVALCCLVALVLGYLTGRE